MTERKTNQKIKTLVISDKFKGTLSSKEVGIIVSNKLNEKNYDCSYLEISDGGEGFLNTIEFVLNKKAIPYIIENVLSYDALMNKTNSSYIYVKNTNTAYFEFAECCGIAKLGTNNLDAKNATSYGLGDVIKKAVLKYDIKNIVVGIGGSASSDAGLGMLKALGIDFYHGKDLISNYGNEALGYIDNYNKDNFILKNKEYNVTVLSDVTNPLLGQSGAVYIYGMQKGFKEEELKHAEENVKHFSKIIKEDFNNEYELSDGSGACGGVGYAFKVFMNAKMMPGINYLLELLSFDKLINEYDLIITGEGAIDNQSFYGKVISGILSYKPKNVKYICGINNSNLNHNEIYAIVPTIMSKEESIKNPKEALEKLIERSF